MTPLFKKMQWKGQTTIVIHRAPDSFDSELEQLEGIQIEREPKKAKSIDFYLSFVTKLSEIESAAKSVVPKLSADALFWFAYPKGTSKRYRCEFNRDTGWQALGDAGFEPVRMVAIDEDWSAIRFRKTELVKKFTRSAEFAMSKTGKERAQKERAKTTKENKISKKT